MIIISLTHTRNSFSEGTWEYFVFEELPQIGTVLMGIISGFLFIQVSKNQKKWFPKKIKNLLIPFLLANLLVLVLVLIADLFLGINTLNRLDFTSIIVTDGIFALNAPPINPPTYFIRDLFILYCIISLIFNKNFKTLIFILPVLLFGEIFLKTELPFLFLLGCSLGHFYEIIKKYNRYIVWVLIGILVFYFVLFSYDILKIKYLISLLIFIIFVNLNIKFYNLGAYSYLYYLYHSPIIVISFPILNKFVNNILYNSLIQILVCIFCSISFYLLTRKFKYLRIFCGGK